MEYLNSPRNLIAAQTAYLTRSTLTGSAEGGLAIPQQLQNALQQSNLEPGEYTIQFTAMPPADKQGFAAYAIINWKVAGQQITRKVSVFNGVSVSGVAEAVDVALVDCSQVTPGFASGFPTSFQPYQIGVNLSRGTRANIQQPATLVTQLAAISLDKTQNQIWTPPSDAGVVSAMVVVARQAITDIINPTDVVAQQLSTGNVPLNSWYPAQYEQWIPMMAGSNKILISNFSTTAGVNRALVNVIWGIDG